MELTAWCYYLVPLCLAPFGLAMALFVSKGLKKRTGRIELELERLAYLKAQTLKV